MPYISLEEPLKLIHKRFVSLDESEVNLTTPVVRKVLLKLVDYMKDDAIFDELYKNLYFGGSFYHNLKIQNPDEFDIDFLLLLPTCQTCKVKKCKCIKIIPTPMPGFLYFKMKKKFWPNFYETLCNRGYVQTNLVYNWMKSLIYKALNRYKKEENMSLKNVEVSMYTECSPALKICIKYERRLIYIDLAAAFKFDQKYWPSERAGYTKNTTKIRYFSIVPSSPKGLNNYWRPSFQEQEKEIIARKERLKPALRLLKMMKINLNHTVPSYVLKTLIMEEADNFEWKNMSLADTFMMLLRKYVNCLRENQVLYYWNNNVNLLDYIKDVTLLNHYNEVNKLYLKIQREYEEKPSIVAEVVLRNSPEYNEFCRDWCSSHILSGKADIEYRGNTLTIGDLRNFVFGKILYGI